MAERLDFFDFTPVRPAGRAAKYPWRQWTDGSIWQIRRGIDYEVATRSMQATLFAYAGRERLALRTRRVDVDGRDGLVFRFAPRGSGVGDGAADDDGRSWR